MNGNVCTWAVSWGTISCSCQSSNKQKSRGGHANQKGFLHFAPFAPRKKAYLRYHWYFQTAVNNLPYPSSLKNASKPPTALWTKEGGEGRYGPDWWGIWSPPQPSLYHTHCPVPSSQIMCGGPFLLRTPHISLTCELVKFTYSHYFLALFAILQLHYRFIILVICMLQNSASNHQWKKSFLLNLFKFTYIRTCTHTQCWAQSTFLLFKYALLFLETGNLPFESIKRRSANALYFHSASLLFELLNLYFQSSKPPWGLVHS